jgi:hypothetical protein
MRDILVEMDGFIIENDLYIGKDRVTPTPIAVIAGCTMLVERGFAVLMCSCDGEGKRNGCNTTLQGSMKRGKMLSCGKSDTIHGVLIDSEEFARFGCGVACAIASWYLLPLPLMCQLREGNCHAGVRCLQRI